MQETCRVCGQEKDESEFSSRELERPEPMCRECYNAYMRELYHRRMKADPDYARRKSEQFRLKHPNYFKEYMRKKRAKDEA